MNAPIAHGVIHGMDIHDYHAIADAISKTGLDRIRRSPAHYYALTIDPDRPPEKERAGQLEGNLAHCAILEPDEFSKRYAVIPESAPRRPTAAQWNAKKPSPESVEAMNWWRAWESENGSRTIITPEQYAAAIHQQVSVHSLPDVAEALATGWPEVSAFWTDPETGVMCRCRPDWVHPVDDDSVILLDLKTYSDASTADFARQVARKRYHVQAAYYSDGFAAASGKRVLAFIFVCVESEWPHAASATVLDDLSIEQGRTEYREDLRAYAECLRTGKWPGYGAGIHTISLPNWAITIE